MPVRLSVNDAGQRDGRAGVCLGGWLEEGAGVPVRAFLLVAQLVVVGPEATAAEPARIRLLACKYNIYNSLVSYLPGTAHKKLRTFATSPVYLYR